MNYADCVSAHSFVLHCSPPLNPNTFRKFIIEVPPELIDMCVVVYCEPYIEDFICENT